MPTFKEIAEELLERVDVLRDSFREKIKKGETENSPMNNGAIAGAVVGGIGAAALGLARFAGPAVLLAGLGVGLGAALIKSITSIKNDVRTTYTVKDVSKLTGIEDWKLRRYISSGKLTAKSGNSSAANPGKAGYTIQKNDLIEFLKTNPKDFKSSEDSVGKEVAEMQFSEESVVDELTSLISEIDNAVMLGELELKLSQLTTENDTENKEYLINQILVRKLTYAKSYCEKTVKSLENGVS